MNGMFDHLEKPLSANLYKLFSLLSLIVNLVCTHSIHVKTVEYVHELLKEYNNLFIATFGEVATINQHMVMHTRGSNLSDSCECEDELWV